MRRPVVAKRLVTPRSSFEALLTGNSLLGPSAFYAALTGFFLWMSSLVSAAGENWARAVRLEDRLATNVKVMRTVGLARARTTAVALVGCFGGIIGNVSLGWTFYKITFSDVLAFGQAGFGPDVPFDQSQILSLQFLFTPSLTSPAFDFSVDDVAFF